MKAHQNIDKNIGENSHIGRYSKGQISTDNIGGRIYWSVSITLMCVCSGEQVVVVPPPLLKFHTRKA